MGKATLSAVIERVAVLVDGGHGRRTAPVALQARCRAERGHVRGIADRRRRRRLKQKNRNWYQKRDVVNEMLQLWQARSVHHHNLLNLLKSPVWRRFGVKRVHRVAYMEPPARLVDLRVKSLRLRVRAAKS